MNDDDVTDERIRARLHEIVSHDLPEIETPSASSGWRRRSFSAALVAAGCLVVIVGLLVVVQNDQSNRVVQSPGPSSSTTTAPTTSVPAVRGLTNFPLEPRWNVAFVAVPDGFIIWGGGREAQNMGLPPLVPDRAEYADGARYRASTDSWTMIPPAPLSVDLRVVGGRHSVGVWSANTLYVARGEQAAAWTPAARAWRRLPDLSTRVEGLVAVNGQVIAIGPDVALTTPDATTWTPLPARPPVGEHLGLHAIRGGDTIYVVPSVATSGTRYRIVAYSTTSRTWRELPAPPIGTGALDAGWDASGLVIVNHSTQDATTDHPRSVRESARFDPATNTWTRLENLPEPLETKGEVHLVGTDDRFVANGATGSAILVGTTWTFQPAPAHTLDSVVSDGVIYTLTLPPIGEAPTPTHNVVVAD